MKLSDKGLALLIELWESRGQRILNCWLMQKCRISEADPIPKYVHMRVIRMRNLGINQHAFLRRYGDPRRLGFGLSADSLMGNGGSYFSDKVKVSDQEL